MLYVITRSRSAAWLGMYFTLQWHLWCGSKKWTCYTELWKRTHVLARSVYCRVKNEESRLFCRIRQGFFFFFFGVKILFFVSKIVSLHSFLVLLEGLLSSCMFNLTNSNSKHGAVFPDRWIYEKVSVPIDGEMAPLRSEFAKTRRSQERWKFHSDVLATQITRISGISICSRTPSNTFAFWNEFT